MKPSYRFPVLTLVTVFVLLASACAPTSSAPAFSGGSGKAQPSAVEFTGVIEAISGNQWTINGQAVTVDPQTASGAQFAVGDTVRVKGAVTSDGLVTASQVSAPGVSSAASSSSSDAASASADVSSNSANDSTGEDVKVTGVVDAIDGNQITIDGVTYTVADGVDLSGIAVGDTVTIELVTNADGTQTATEVESDDSSDDDDNSNGDDDADDSDDDADDDQDDDEDDDEDEDEDDGDDDNSNGG